jgi:protein required for attachment to host cells
MKRLVRHARVLVTDGAKALVLRNEGDAFAPDLKLVRSYAQDNPPDRDLARDKPPRTNDSMGRRSSIEVADLHQVAEDRFVAGIAEDMGRDLRAGDFENIIVVAPPVALGVYRKAAPAALSKVTILELDKDLTKHTPSDIASHLLKALEEA